VALVLRRILVTQSAVILLMASFSAARAPQQPTDRTATLKVGDIAPDFSLSDQNGKPVKLSDFRGKQNVVLAFFVLAFTGG
jgi:cytochrome oxidase Cu insertion factor (SCO1/SenC/PrrC family)